MENVPTASFDKVEISWWAKRTFWVNFSGRMFDKTKKQKSAPQTLSSMATKLVNWDRMENSLLSSMMKCFSSAFFPWEKRRQCEKLGIKVSTFVLFWTAHAHTHAPRVQLRPSPGFRLQNPEWGLLPWACEETAHKHTHRWPWMRCSLRAKIKRNQLFFFCDAPILY